MLNHYQLGHLFVALVVAFLNYLSATSLQGSSSIFIPMVEVANPGNKKDPATLVGSVAYAFSIAKFDITIGQYTTFLNAVAKSDPNGLYNSKMTTDLQVSGIIRSGCSGDYSYTVAPPNGPVQISAATAKNRPITYVSWFDSVRFANWMSNGQPIGLQTSKTTENGAYDLIGLTDALVKIGYAISRNKINPNTGAAPIYSLPSESEWYKAAYYNPSMNNGTGAYTLYATNTNSISGNIPGDMPNFANIIYKGLMAVTQKINFSCDQITKN